MKRSHKIINGIYIAFFLALIIISGVIVFGSDQSVWESRKSEVLRCGEYAMDSFYSYTNTLLAPLSDEQIHILEKRTQSLMTQMVQKVTINDQCPEGAEDLEEYQIWSTFLRMKGKSAGMEVLCRADFQGTAYYISLQADFTDLSAKSLKTRRIYAASAAAVILFCGAFFILLNLLWLETDKSKKFMENFNHELKTPLTSILGYTEILQSMSLTEDERKHALDALSFEATRLNHLSTQMLNIFITQNEKPELSTVAASDIAAELEIPLDALSEKYDVPYTIRFEDETILCSKDLLLLLITNLADNAFKATVNAERNDPVVVEGKRSSSGYLISVRDHGIGISRQHIKRITEPFYREDKARSRAQGGAGLGLALCSEIAQMHGSALSFASRKGSGTRVSFELKRSGL